jgi:hypothetical protein
MAIRTTSAKSKSSAAKSTIAKSTATKKTITATIDESPDPAIAVIKEAHCQNLQGTATLEYHIGRDDKGGLHWRIQANSGAGMFSKAWISFDAIQKVLEKCPKDSPITSITLAPVCKGSVNTRSFLLATLVNEGILQPVPDKKRHYQLGDSKPFLAEVNALRSQHSDSTTGKPKANAKAAARMPKGKANPGKGKQS